MRYVARMMSDEMGMIKNEKRQPCICIFAELPLILFEVLFGEIEAC